MQILAGSSQITRSDRFAVARSAFTSILLVVVGLLMAWLCLATPLVTSFVPQGRPSVAETATGAVAWGFAILVPAAFLIIGVARIAAIVDTASQMRPRISTSNLAKALGPEYVAATGLVVPGGRRVHELVLGPFGILVLAVVPPSSITRHVGSRWEIRDERGRWVPIEAPLDRATRDAERVRGWLGGEDRDFVVRVYAADRDRRRRASSGRPTCAVVPPQRPGRLARGAAGAARPERRAPRVARGDDRRGRRRVLTRRARTCRREGW